MKTLCLLFTAMFAVCIAYAQTTCVDTNDTYVARATGLINYSAPGDSGYIFGNNLYTSYVGDNFDVDSGALTGVLIWFGAKAVGKPTDSINVFVFNTSPTDSLPTGQPIAEGKISMADIDTAFNTSPINFTYVAFNPPVSVKTNYAIVVQTYYGTTAGSDNAGDTISILGDSQGDGASEWRSIAFYDGQWLHMGDLWTDGSGLPQDVDGLMEPILNKGFYAAINTYPKACPGGIINLNAIASSCSGIATYLWSGPGVDNPFNSYTTASIPTNQTDSVVYTLTVIDRANDTLIKSITIATGNISISAGNDTTIQCGATTTLTATVTGKVDAGTYIQWQDGPTGPNYPNVGTGLYTVSVVNAIGCRATSTVTISIPDGQVVSFALHTISLSKIHNVGIDTVLYNPCSGSIDTIENTSSTINNWTWVWKYSGGGLSTDTSLILPVNTFAIGVTDTITLIGDSANCEVTSSLISICGQSSNLSVTISGRDSICDGDSITLIAIASGGIGNYTYDWYGVFNGTDSIVVTGGGNYWVEVFDSDHHVSDASITVSVFDSCRLVWPGDANDNGVAEYNDVLQIALAFGDIGSVRPNASLQWIGQTATNWNGTTNGVNNKFADCDGNGIINYDDTLAVTQNYSLTHNKTGGLIPRATDPVLTLVPESDSILPNTPFKVKIMLGNASNPVDTLYGLAFSINFNPAIFDTANVQLTANTSWLGNGVLTFRKVLVSNGQLVMVLSATNQSDIVGGNGQVGELTLMAQPNLPSYIGNYTITPTVLKGITAASNPKTFNVQTTQANVISGIAEVQMDKDVTVYPNPNNGHFQFTFDEPSKQLTIELLNIEGQLLYTEQLKDVPSLNKDYDFSNLAKGVYLLKVSNENGVAVKRLVVQ